MIVLVIFALICDLIGLIPLAKDITATIFWGIASLYFWKQGMGLFNGKKLATMAISWVSGMIPGLQELPVELTAGIIAIFLITRAEEETGLSLLDPMKKGIKPAALYKDGKRLPPPKQELNSGGARQPQENSMENTQAENHDRQRPLVDNIGKPNPLNQAKSKQNHLEGIEPNRDAHQQAFKDHFDAMNSSPMSSGLKPGEKLEVALKASDEKLANADHRFNATM